MMMRFIGVILALALTGPVAAQDMTLRDIRDDLAILTEQIESLRIELGATGNSGLSTQEAAGAQVQIDELTADLRAALGRIEALEIKIQQIIEDGTRRIGDIEFRLTEIEGGDTSLATNPAPLGGTESQTEVLSAERKAFNDAKKALEEGDGVSAANLFATFLGTFPDGPLTSEVRYLQGEAHSQSGDYQNAARAYLSGFSGAPDSPFAPNSLYGLSISLFQLGQGDQACLTLAEIQIRYVEIDDDLSRDIIEQREAMACP